MTRRFKIEATDPTDDKYPVRLAVWVMLPGSDKADPNLTLERHCGEHLAIEVARDILKRCPSVPPELVSQLDALHAATGSTRH